MDVVKFELSKIFLSPIVWLLMMGLTLLSYWFITANVGDQSQLSILTTMVATYGAEINEESLAGWRQLHAIELEAMNKITKFRIGQTFPSVAELQRFAYETGFNERDIFIEVDEWQQFERTSVVENYFLRAEGADDYYRGIDLNDFGEELIENMGASGPLAEIILENFSAHQEVRFSELIKNGEHLHFFFNGYFHGMHLFLFNSFLGIVTLGITVIVALVSAFLFGYEFDSKTNLLVYSTALGRKLQLEKLKAAGVATIMITLIMLVVSLGIFFLTYDYSGLWQVPISSIFMSTPLILFVSRYALTFGQYLIGVCALIIIAQLLFVKLTFCLFKLSKSSYLSVIYFSLIGAIGMTAGLFFPLHSRLLYFSGFNPFYMIHDLSGSFMIWDVSQTFQHFELATISIWVVILSVLSISCFQRFKKIDL